jgi:hypothetical protein
LLDNDYYAIGGLNKIDIMIRRNGHFIFSGCWVEHWKHEAAIPLKKCDNPVADCSS